MSSFVGIDFGTTNSAVAITGEEGPVTLALFPQRGGPTNIFRSVVFFDPIQRDRRGLIPATGPAAIEARLDAQGEGRLLQSLKTYLANRGFTGTNVYGRQLSVEDLVSLIVRGLGDAARAQFPQMGGSAVVGRPVRFSHAEQDDDNEFALARLRTALERAGFDQVIFEYEPVGAAYYYESGLARDELVLIADFGGGTSDFSLMRVGPGMRSRPSSERMLGAEGVALAGDAFDARIVDHVVAPRLGHGTSYRAFPDNKLMTVPSWLYSRLRRWHHLSFLNSRETMALLHDVADSALEPEMIRGLIHLIEHDLGYDLYQAVVTAKVGLSDQDQVDFAFRERPIDIRVTVRRAEFEEWIAVEVAAIRDSVDRLFARTAVDPAAVDRVFLTGGSSFVPAVRRIFEERFGAARISRGNELTSVALGLALRARDLGNPG